MKSITTFSSMSNKTNIHLKPGTFGSVKALTSLEIRNQKNMHSFQSRQSDMFLKFSKSQNISQFLVNHPFLICFRFTEAPNFLIKDLKLSLSIFSNNFLRIDDYASCQHLVHASEYTPEWLAKVLASGAVFLVGLSTEDAYLETLKKIIVLERDSSKSVMIALLFVKENTFWLNMSKSDSTACVTRDFYRTWDSKGSILLELVGTLSSIPHQLTGVLSAELIVATELSLPRILVSPQLN